MRSLPLHIYFSLPSSNSSSFLIQRDPFRTIRRGRPLFQRKFQHMTGAEGTFYARDGFGGIDHNLAIGAGLTDSCASCHGRPRGSAGFGGDVVTRPDSRDAPHLFGLGLKEMLADEITADLRDRRARALAEAVALGPPVTRAMTAKGIESGTITANPDGAVDTSQVIGVDPDLRVRPFFAHGGTASIREFIAGDRGGRLPGILLVELLQARPVRANASRAARAADLRADRLHFLSHIQSTD